MAIWLDPRSGANLAVGILARCSIWQAGRMLILVSTGPFRGHQAVKLFGNPAAFSFESVGSPAVFSLALCSLVALSLHSVDCSWGPRTTRISVHWQVSWNPGWPACQPCNYPGALDAYIAHRPALMEALPPCCKLSLHARGRTSGSGSEIHMQTHMRGSDLLLMRGGGFLA